MNKVFLYWDNSNIFTSAKDVAVEMEGEAARFRVRIDFRNLLALARADREIEHAVAVGSIPPELRHVWNRLENAGVTVQLLERGAMRGGEQGVDQTLQTAMLRDAFDHNGDPEQQFCLRATARGSSPASASTRTWNGCTGGGGASRCCPGVGAATAGCGSGRKRTASSSRWTTSTRASHSWSVRRPASRWPTFGFQSRWTSASGLEPTRPANHFTKPAAIHRLGSKRSGS